MGETRLSSEEELYCEIDGLRAKLAAVDKQREDFFWDKQRAEAEALKAKAHIAALCDAMVYSDSYGVQGSEFQCCHACNAGGAPNVVFKHDEHCPVGKAEASAAEWWDDYKAAEEDRERAETERDALLYNAESQYCAGMSAGFELGRNDDRAELSRIITQRWSEIADAKARAALAPSPAGREG